MTTSVCVELNRRLVISDVFLTAHDAPNPAGQKIPKANVFDLSYFD